MFVQNTEIKSTAARVINEKHMVTYNKELAIESYLVMSMEVRGLTQNTGSAAY